MSDPRFTYDGQQGGDPGDSFTGGFQADRGEGLALPPWERRERFGFLNGLYLTVKDVLFSPGRFFKQMPSAVGLTQPLLFAILIGAVATFVSWMWTLTGSSLQMLLQESMEEVVKGPLYSFLTFLFSPMIITVVLFIQAGLTHLTLVLIGGNRLGFEATFRVSAYAEAASLLIIMPVCGAWIAVIWNLVTMVIGLYSIHETEPWKAVVAVLAPMLLCLSSIGGGLVLLLVGAS